jgi:hypothetical protein
VIVWVGVDWIDRTRARERWRAIVNAIMNLRFSWNAGAFWSACAIGGLLSSAQLHGVS